MANDPRNRILDGCKRFSSYYIREKLKIKVAKWGTPEKYLQKKFALHFLIDEKGLSPSCFIFVFSMHKLFTNQFIIKIAIKNFFVILITRVAKCETATSGEKSAECEISKVLMREANRSAQNRNGFRWMQTTCWQIKLQINKLQQ
jgi:hypothetical protein